MNDIDNIDFDNIDIDKIRGEIRTFNNDANVQKLDAYYNSKSMPEIFGVSRKEMSHSNFLAWILNSNESHLLREYPLMKFLELLVIDSNEKQNEPYKELYDSIILSDYELKDICTETEKVIEGGRRIDVYVEASIKYKDKSKRLRLIVENKVGTKEHDDQTLKYFNYFEKRREQNEINIYVYLTPISSIDLSELEEHQCSCEDYILINYQSIVDYLLEPAIQKNITDKTKFIIKEYLQSLSQPTLDKEDDEYKEGLIMALGTDERNLLTKFWEKNQKLILAALYAISSDPKQEKEIRESASDAIDNLSSTGKNKSLCSIKFNGVIEAENFKKSDVGLKTIKILEKKGLIDNISIEFLKNDKSCSFRLLKSAEEITDSEIKYRRYRHTEEPELYYNNIGYYVVRNWGINNIFKFKRNMEHNFEDLDIIVHEE